MLRQVLMTLPHPASVQLTPLQRRRQLVKVPPRLALAMRSQDLHPDPDSTAAQASLQCLAELIRFSASCGVSRLVLYDQRGRLVRSRERLARLLAAKQHSASLDGPTLLQGFRRSAAELVRSVVHSISGASMFATDGRQSDSVGAGVSTQPCFRLAVPGASLEDARAHSSALSHSEACISSTGLWERSGASAVAGVAAEHTHSHGKMAATDASEHCGCGPCAVSCTIHVLSGAHAKQDLVRPATAKPVPL